MVVYVFEFDIVPGKYQEFWHFMEEEGTPFWLKFPEVKKYEVYSKVGGRANFEGHVVLNSYSDYDKIMNHPDAMMVGAKTSQLTQNTQRRFIQLAKVYE